MQSVCVAGTNDTVTGAYAAAQYLLRDNVVDERRHGLSQRTRAVLRVIGRRRGGSGDRAVELN